MANHALAISNPPHGNVAYEEAAPSFGLSPAEVRMKANYPIPEIWIAGDDGSLVTSAAKVLQNSGLSVTITSAEDLAAVPNGDVAEKIEFTDSGFSVLCDGSSNSISRESRTVVVYCRPQSTDIDKNSHKVNSLRSRMSHSSVIVGDRSRTSSLMELMGGSNALDEGVPFIDVYYEIDGDPSRVSLVAGTTFIADGDSGQILSVKDMPSLVKRISETFTDLRVDERLVGMRIRRRQMVGTVKPNESRRKGFSFASAGLTRLLEEISPALKNISDTDFSSRLAFITTLNR